MPAKLTDRHLCLKQILCGGRSQNDDHFRPHHCDLAFQKWLASDRLVRFRGTISRRTAAVDIADKDVLSRYLQAFFDNIGQQLPRTPNKRKPLLVLIRPGRLANEHQVSVEIARTIDDL